MKSILRRLALVLGPLTIAATSLCCKAPSEPPKPRLVVLYATCTVRSDLLSPYDAQLEYTPALARFAGEAAVFTQHRTEAGQSGVAYASILSGRQAPGHGIFRHPKRIHESVKTLSETFIEGGYEVYFWYTKGNASPELNYAQGVPESNVRNAHLEGDDPLFREILTRVNEDPDFKALVIYAGSLSHAPYAGDNLDRFCDGNPELCADISGIPTERRNALLDLFSNYTQAIQFNFDATVKLLELNPEAVQELTALLDTAYRSRLQVLDDSFGGIVAALDSADLLDSSVVSFTADHGEYLSGPQQPFKWEHGWILPRATLDVPWIVRAPLLVPAQRIDSVTRSTDVLPTLAGLAGLDTSRESNDTDLSGVDLSPMLRASKPIPELLAFSHGAMVPDFYYGGERAPMFGPLWELFPEPSPDYLWVAVRSGSTIVKQVRLDETWQTQAFELETDPHELDDVFDPGLERHAEIDALLSGYKAWLTDGYWAVREFERTGNYEDIPDDEKLEILRSLGYLK